MSFPTVYKTIRLGDLAITVGGDEQNKKNIAIVGMPYDPYDIRQHFKMGGDNNTHPRLFPELMITVDMGKKEEPDENDKVILATIKYPDYYGSGHIGQKWLITGGAMQHWKPRKSPLYLVFENGLPKLSLNAQSVQIIDAPEALEISIVNNSLAELMVFYKSPYGKESSFPRKIIAASSTEKLWTVLGAKLVLKSPSKTQETEVASSVIRFSGPISSGLPPELNEISKWLPNRHFKRIYKAVPDQFANTFFRDSCWNKGACVFVVSVGECRFGGYVPHGWDGCRTKNRNQTSFMFTLAPKPQQFKIASAEGFPDEAYAYYSANPDTHVEMGCGDMRVLTSGKDVHFKRIAQTSMFGDTNPATWTGQNDPVQTVTDIEVYQIIV